MTIKTTAENNPGLLDQIFGTESVWTGRALEVESGKEATAYGNSKSEAEFNAARELSKKLDD